MKKLLCFVFTILILFSSISFVYAENPVKANDEWLVNWSSRINPTGKVWQCPGEDENDRVITWISKDIKSTFYYSKECGEKISVKPEKKLFVSGVINSVTLKDLEDGTYYYSYTADSIEYKNNMFTIKALDKSFTAMFCSDPQLGRSDNDSEIAIQNDTYGWERTVQSAYDNGAELILSAGDQVNDGFSLKQYNALLSADNLSNVPFAPTAGNHEFYSHLFSAYFSNCGTNSIGNNYYFTFGNALFIVLNSNNILSLIHKNTIKTAIKENPDAKWRVVMLHHGAYSSYDHDFSNKMCTVFLKSIFDSYGIDLVLSGHNHCYSRTMPIYKDVISNMGTIYFEAGSASGGKCNINDVSKKKYIAFSAPLQQASYSLLTFNDDEIIVKSYLTDTGEEFDSFTIAHTEKPEPLHYSFFFSQVSRMLKEFFNSIPEAFS